MKLDIARAWKDETYRQSLSSEELAQLPENPAGEMELNDAELDAVQGGAFGQFWSNNVFIGGCVQANSQYKGNCQSQYGICQSQGGGNCASFNGSVCNSFNKGDCYSNFGGNCTSASGSTCVSIGNSSCTVKFF